MLAAAARGGLSHFQCFKDSLFRSYVYDHYFSTDTTRYYLDFKTAKPLIFVKLYTTFPVYALTGVLYHQLGPPPNKSPICPLYLRRKRAQKFHMKVFLCENYCENENSVKSLEKAIEKLEWQNVIPLKCAVKEYAWGKVGDESKVALLAKNDPSFNFDPKSTYAELWMGTHPKGPSTVSCQTQNGMAGKELKEVINAHPELLGQAVLDKFNRNLPFLFKVLSVNKSLSIQAHPTKDHAAKLHSSRPDLYPDPNHKPEMAVALTRFEALCGFRPVSEILNYLHDVPEFLAVVGQKAVDQLIEAEHCSVDRNCSKKQQAVKKALKECFSCVMKCDERTVEMQTSKIVERLQECHTNREDTTSYLGRLFLRIYNEFPGDIGCFVIYFLNHITLQPGEAIFLGPNYPHAYLSGDCVECMACSDNVVRAGLTPKYKDVPTLCEMLDYTPRTPNETKFVPTSDAEDPYVLQYVPPLEEFAVSRIQLPAECEQYTLTKLQGASILLTVDGEGVAKGINSSCSGEQDYLLRPGTVLFIAVSAGLSISKSIGTELLLFRAYCPVRDS